MSLSGTKLNRGPQGSSLCPMSFLPCTCLDQFWENIGSGSILCRQQPNLSSTNEGMEVHLKNKKTKHKTEFMSTWVLSNKRLKPAATSLKLDVHISSVVKSSSFLRLRQLARAKPFLSLRFYSNLLLQHIYIIAMCFHVGVSQKSLSQLQLLLNAAAGRQEHITQI